VTKREKECTMEDILNRLDDVFYETRIAISMIVLLCFLNFGLVAIALAAWIVFGENAGK